jgi:hypothetical protein
MQIKTVQELPRVFLVVTEHLLEHISMLIFNINLMLLRIIPEELKSLLASFVIKYSEIVATRPH